MAPTAPAPTAHTKTQPQPIGRARQILRGGNPAVGRLKASFQENHLTSDAANPVPAARNCFLNFFRGFVYLCGKSPYLREKVERYLDAGDSPCGISARRTFSF